MGQLAQRIIAMSGAILFILSSVGITGVMIYTNMQDDKRPATDVTAAADTCQPTGQAEETLSVPEPFTTTEPVTELQTTDLSPGDGETAKNGDCLIMKYYGTLASTGAKFDENFTQPTAFAFNLGQGKVIPGWDQGLVGMQVGAVRRLVIPAQLAYGENSPSEAIPANSDLVFVVKLLRIQK